MFKRKLKLSGLLLGIALLVAACGGGGETPTATPAPPTETPVEEAATEVPPTETSAPVEEATEAAGVPTEVTVEAPTEVPVEAPTEAPTEVAQAPTVVPETAPTEETTEAPTEAAAVEPTATPAEMEPTPTMPGDTGAVEVGGEQPVSGAFGFRANAALDTLVAGSPNGTTLFAFLSNRDGDGIDGERVRFVLHGGTAVLRDLNPGAPEAPNPIAVNGYNIGNGIYVAGILPGNVSEAVTVAAQWLTAPESPVPVASIPINVITAANLQVRVDDEFILADGRDAATIIAYVLDDLNKPVPLNPEDIRFQVLNGPGTVTPINSPATRNGRYAAVYGPVTNPGETLIEVSLPRITNPIRQTVTIQAVESTTLEAHVFPARVVRRLRNLTPNETHVATILVSVHDGDGEIVTGLRAADLQARVVSGPGEMQDGGFRELLNAGGGGTGVYQFQFVTDEITGTSVIEVTDLSSPSRGKAQVTVETVAGISPSVIQNVEMVTVADTEFFADGKSQALVIAFASDRDGNTVPASRLDRVEFLLIQGQGSADRRGVNAVAGAIATNAADIELDSLLLGAAGNPLPTGIYTSTYTAGSRNEASTANLRAIFSTEEGNVITQVVDINLSQLLPPDVVIFPPTIPQGLTQLVTIDIFDVNDEPVRTRIPGLRYRVEIEQGPGEIPAVGGAPTNLGDFSDVRPADNVFTARARIEPEAGSNQDVRFSIVDEGVSGFPTTDALLTIGQDTRLTAVISPEPGDADDLVQIIVLAQNEFGLPATGHDLIITVVNGSAAAINSGAMVDDGGAVPGSENVTASLPDGIRDAIVNDGAYTGAIQTTGVARGTIIVRITDLTPPSQPSIEIEVPIAAS